jgi:hypothetical protein
VNPAAKAACFPRQTSALRQSMRSPAASIASPPLHRPALFGSSRMPVPSALDMTQQPPVR